MSGQRAAIALGDGEGEALAVADSLLVGDGLADWEAVGEEAGRDAVRPTMPPTPTATTIATAIPIRTARGSWRKRCTRAW